MDLKQLKNYAAKVKLEDNGLDRQIIAKVVGVTFEGRQEVLEAIKKDTSVRLERDRRNQYDFYAVKVMVEINNEWRQAGFIPKSMARLISKTLDNGIPLFSCVHRLTGGGFCEFINEKYNYGLEINIVPQNI